MPTQQSNKHSFIFFSWELKEESNNQNSKSQGPLTY